MTKTKRTHGPLTEEQKRLIEAHWPMVATVVCRMVEQGRIRSDHIDLAFSAAGRIAINAAQSYDGAVARFSTYLWIPLVKYLPVRVGEHRARYEARTLQKEDAEDIQRIARSRRDAWRKPAMVEKNYNLKGHGIHGILKELKDVRPKPDDEAGENDEVARIERLLSECEAELPRPGSLLRRLMDGESTEVMAAEADTSREAINYQIRTAKRWMAWRLFGIADWRESRSRNGAGGADRI